MSVHTKQKEEKFQQSNEEFKASLELSSNSTLEESISSEDAQPIVVDQQGNSCEDSMIEPSPISIEATPHSREATPILEPTNPDEVPQVNASLTTDNNNHIPTSLSDSKQVDNEKFDFVESIEPQVNSVESIETAKPVEVK